MAQPTRAGPSPPRRKTPSGRFWTGKSPAGSFADSTKLRSAGSCVPSVFGITRALRARAGRPPARRTSRSRRRPRSRAAPPRAAAVLARSCRQARPVVVEAESRRRRARAARPRAPRAVAPVAREGGRREHVQEAVHHGARARRLVGERLLGAHRVVQARRGLPRHAGRGAGGDEARDVGRRPGSPRARRRRCGSSRARPARFERREQPSRSSSSGTSTKAVSPGGQRRERRVGLRPGSPPSARPRPRPRVRRARRSRTSTRAASPCASAPRSALRRQGSPAPGSRAGAPRPRGRARRAAPPAPRSGRA